MPMMEPEIRAEAPEEIRKICGKNDRVGVYDAQAWWWFERKTGDLHILPGEEGRMPAVEPGIPREVLMAPVRKLILHDGVKSPRLDFYQSVEVIPEFEELVLPEGLTHLPVICGRFKRMKVPPTVKSMLFDRLFLTCCSHWDPVTYAVKRLVIPSDIVFEYVRDLYDRGALPTCEPIEYMKEIVVYGAEKIPNLLMWYYANVFFKEFDIFYPEAWDEGKPGSYADEIVDFIRAQQPTRPCFGMAPAGRESYSEADYQQIRQHLFPCAVCEAGGPC